MAASRFGGDRLNTRFGAVSMVRVGELLAAFGILVALTVPMAASGIIGFGLAGAGFADLPDRHQRRRTLKDMPPGLAIAAVATCGYSGFLFGPPTIGFVAQATSLRIALGVVVALPAGRRPGARGGEGRPRAGRFR